MADPRPRRIEVNDSGDASAAGYANSGVHIGDVNLQTGLPVRTRYHKQVERIVPPELLDRGDELVDLANFCTSDSVAAPYMWWCAEAWSGKSALMSWFVLNPPSSVRIISFFVTARLSGQNDRTAFIDNALEQVLTILDMSMPPFLTDATREAHFLGLLQDAAEVCQARGERLVLLVDGLDEDRGVRAGHDWHSIAALLPNNLPADMRVIVASRPNPPIPSDVPLSHPLRNKALVRTLTPSPHAARIREQMERELRILLYGSEVEQELLGLLAAAGGGLSSSDLAELSGSSQWEIEERLSTVTGRSFSRRHSQLRHDDAPDVYLLGHEELQTSAENMLGKSRMQSYYDRLSDWADSYRAQRWPGATPEYLLSGYFAKARDLGDVQKVVALATDPHRHQRMLETTGGDAASLTEISHAIDLASSQAEPQLRILIRLAIHRDRLSERNVSIPPRLPSLWVTLGESNRAESIARSMAEVARGGQALMEVARLSAGMGDVDRAEAIARSISDPSRGEQALMEIARLSAGMGDVDRAEAIARSIADNNLRLDLLILIARKASRGDSVERVHSILEQVEAAVSSIAEPAKKGQALADMASVSAQISDTGRTRAILQKTEEIASSIADPTKKARILTSVVRAAAMIGDDTGQVDKAVEQVTHMIDAIDVGQRLRILADLMVILAKAGDLERALLLSKLLTDPLQQAHVLVRLGRSMAELARPLDALKTIGHARGLASIDMGPRRIGLVCDMSIVAATANDARYAYSLLDEIVPIIEAVGDPATRDNLTSKFVRAASAIGAIDRAEIAARTITSESRRSRVLARIVADAVLINRLSQAESIARTITNLALQVRALTMVAVGRYRAGDTDRAWSLFTDTERMAKSIEEVLQRGQALVAVGVAISQAGNKDLARSLFSLAKQEALTIGRPNQQAQVLTRMAGTIAGTGEIDHAESIARSIVNPRWQAEALTEVAAVVAVGDAGRASSLLGQAEDTARMVTNSNRRAHVLIDLAIKSMSLGEREGAHQLLECALVTCQTIGEDAKRLDTIIAVVNAVASIGNYDRAVSIAHSIEDASRRADAAIAIVESAISAGDLDRACSVALSIDVPIKKSHSMLSIATASSSVGDFQRAKRVTGFIVHPAVRARALAVAAQAALRSGNSDLAQSLLDDAASAARIVSTRFLRTRAMIAVAVAARDLDPVERGAAMLRRAEDVASRISNHAQQARAFGELAEAVGAAGFLEHAEEIARSITIRAQLARALIAVSRCAHHVGDSERVERIIDEVEAAIKSIANNSRRTQLFIELSELLTSMGDFRRVEKLAVFVSDRVQRTRALLKVVQTAFAAGDHRFAEMTLESAEEVARAITTRARFAPLADVARTAASLGFLDYAEIVARDVASPTWKNRILVQVAKEAAALGELQKAELIARSVNNLEQRSEAVVEIVRALVTGGDLSRGTALAQTIANPVRRGLALLIVARNSEDSLRTYQEVLKLTPWELSARELLMIDPGAAGVIADELSRVSSSAS